MKFYKKMFKNSLPNIFVRIFPLKNNLLRIVLLYHSLNYVAITVDQRDVSTIVEQQGEMVKLLSQLVKQLQQPVTATTFIQQPLLPTSVVQQPTTATPFIQQPILPTSVVQQPTTATPFIQQPILPTSVVQQPTTATPFIQHPLLLSSSQLQLQPLRLSSN